MSRNYFVQVEISGTPDIDDVAFALEEIGVDDLKYYSKDGTVVAEGRTHLRGRQTAVGAHERMRNALDKEVVVERMISRWKCMDILEWDAVVGGER